MQHNTKFNKGFLVLKIAIFMGLIMYNNKLNFTVLTLKIN